MVGGTRVGRFRCRSWKVSVSTVSVVVRAPLLEERCVHGLPGEARIDLGMVMICVVVVNRLLLVLARDIGLRGVVVMVLVLHGRWRIARVHPRPMLVLQSR